MNLKILILKILISLLVMSGNVFAKAVPPGSGQGDVPANILILLDKSGSMDEKNRMTRLKQSTIKWINYELEEGNQLGIVKFE